MSAARRAWHLPVALAVPIAAAWAFAAPQAEPPATPDSAATLAPASDRAIRWSFDTGG